MARVECPHEADVLAAVSTNRWPRQAEPALRAHVDDCAICREVVAVAALFEDEAAAARAAAPVPESGAVWFRAQMRARQDAARLAVRPVAVWQAVACAVGVGAAGAVFGATASWFQHGVRWLGGAVASTFTLPRLAAPAWLVSLAVDHAGLMAAMAGAGVSLALAVYGLARASERAA